MKCPKCGLDAEEVYYDCLYTTTLTLIVTDKGEELTGVEDFTTAFDFFDSMMSEDESKRVCVGCSECVNNDGVGERPVGEDGR